VYLLLLLFLLFGGLAFDVEDRAVVLNVGSMAAHPTSFEHFFCKVQTLN